MPDLPLHQQINGTSPYDHGRAGDHRRPARPRSPDRRDLPLGRCCPRHRLRPMSPRPIPSCVLTERPAVPAEAWQWVLPLRLRAMPEPEKVVIAVIDAEGELAKSSTLVEVSGPSWARGCAHTGTTSAPNGSSCAGP